MIDRVKRGYRVPEVCKLAGISYRQLDYWARTGLAVPSLRDADGSGTQRVYSVEDVAYIRVIALLLRTGMSLQVIRRAVEDDRLRPFLSDVLDTIVDCDRQLAAV